MEKTGAQTPTGLAQEPDEPQTETETRRAQEAEGTETQPRLLEESELANFRGRWYEIQSRFVDDPRAAVEQADSLVDDLVKRIAESFGEQRSQLEADWDRDDDVTTENLRLALRRYRFFFNRLLDT
jgi:hypothetical protein